MRIALCLFLLVGFSAHADFHLAEQALPGMGLPISLAKSTVRITLLLGKNDTESSDCSGSVISDTGHILTAGHCAERCLLANGAYDSNGGMAVINLQRLANVQCRFSINGNVINARILSTNNCLSTQLALVANPFCNGLDYAIIEPIEKVNIACSPVDLGNSLPVGTPVTALGYPMATQRMDEIGTKIYDSDGTNLFVSDPGKTIDFAWSCKWHSGFGLKQIPIQTERANKGIVQQQLNVGNLLQTTVDIVEGNSGGPLVNLSSGAIVGIASFIPSPAQDEYSKCEGSTFFTSTSGMAKEIRTKLNTSQIEKITTCAINK